MIRSTAAAPALLAVVLLTGCGGETEVAGDTTTAPPEITASATPSEAPVIAEGTPAPVEPADDAQRISLTLAGGEVTGDTGRVEVPLDGEVVLVITSDVADEVHVHGYDQTVPVPPGEPTEVRFTADTPGVFEVEMHDSGVLLTRLQVR